VNFLSFGLPWLATLSLSIVLLSYPMAVRILWVAWGNRISASDDRGDDWVRGAVATIFPLAAFLVVTGGVANWTRNFDFGLMASALAVIVLFSGERARGLRGEGLLRGSSRARLIPARLSRRAWIFWMVTVSIVLVYGKIAFSYQLHDEHALFGHKAIVEQMRHNVFPPHFPPFPSFPARYHFGFDILAGALARAFGLPSDLAIDLSTLFLVVLMSVGARALVSRCASVWAPGLAVLATHFGGGLAAWMLAVKPGRHIRCLAQYHHPSCGVELFPAQFLNVFQHPVSLGVPLWMLAGLLGCQWLDAANGEDRRPTVVFGALTVGLTLTLAALSLAQFVFFSLSVLAWLFVGVWHARRSGGRAAAWFVGSILLSVPLSWALGGMWTPTPFVQEGLVVWRSALGFPKGASWFGVFRHLVANLGVGFLCLPWMVWQVVRRADSLGRFLLVFAVGGLLVPQLFDYPRSWDIVKFPSAASFSLSIAYVLLVDDELRRCRRWQLLLRPVGLAALLTTGLTSVVLVGFPGLAEPRLYPAGDYAVDPRVDTCIRWLWSHGYRSEERVLAQDNIAKQLSVFGGLSVVGEDVDLYYTGVRTDLLGAQRIHNRTAERTMNDQALEQLGVRWLVYSDEELQNLGPAARARLTGQDGPFWVVFATDAEPSPKRRRIFAYEKPDAWVGVPELGSTDR
jgi:hypothetical protein